MNDKQKRTISGLGFASPWIVGFVVLILFPFFASLYLSFCRWDMLTPPKWIGFENYERLVDEFQSGEGVATALWNTIYFSLLSVPLSVILGIGLAVMLSWPVRGQAFFRTVFFLPSVIPIIATCILWLWLLDPNDGWVNYLLSYVHLPSQNWLNQSRSAVSIESVETIRNWSAGDGRLTLLGSKDSLVLITLWTVGNFIVIYLAALGDVPHSLYEAAHLEGISRFRRFIHITLPMLTPVIFFNLVVGLIRSVQTFTSIYVLSEGTGAPGDSLVVISLHLFLAAFVDLQMGYASAVAWILFCVLVICTFLLFRTSKHWVYYRFG